KSTEHKSVIGSEAPAPAAVGKPDIIRELRRVLKTGLAKELEGPLPAAPPPHELHRSVQDFCALRDDAQRLGLAYPSASMSASPELVAFHLLRQSQLLMDEIVADLGDVDADYNFDDEYEEIVADAMRRSRSISAVQRHNQFANVTHHALVRAALTRIS